METSSELTSSSLNSSKIKSFSLAGRKVFVTGGSRGIGRACAVTLAAAGADVAVGSSPSGAETAEAVCLEIREMGRKARAYAFDVSVPAEVATMCSRVEDELQGVDILINNAGVTRDGLFRKMGRSDWDTVINTNLNSVFDITQRFIEPMAGRGWGRIINISSIVGRIGSFGQTNYAAAKAGLIGFTKALAREYARKGVTVNAIAPGFVRTRMLDAVPEKALQSVLSVTPLGRFADPMEIGASALYLASEAASFVTGHVLDVNGGMAM
jgi:3-oxoacyl-[acyl-carrier protein] reductase